MTTKEFHRKLTAILSADIVGYSRLMREDEESTVRTLNKYKEMIFGLIKSNNGRLVDSPGDNLLAEFVSVVDAVRCAVQIQEDLKVNNEELSTNRKMEFRIGINTGDVIQDGDRIYGDGVNVAARIESLADPGGVCISRTAYDQVKKKMNIDYEYLGEYEVKNIDEPVRVYRIRMEPETATLKTPAANDVKEGPKTIAVLPFVDLSPEKDQEYFVDGLSEELLNNLDKIPDLLVTARTSSFSFKGTNKTIQEIASVLRVDNILEGSVRKAGNALRISAQLIRVTDGFHLWSHTYNRKLEDIFAVQEDIAKAVANELKITLGIGKSLKPLGSTDNVNAYELYLIAKRQMWEINDLAMMSHAIKAIDDAIALDPEFALAWAAKAYIHGLFAIWGPAKDAITERDAAQNAALKTIELEPNLPEAHEVLGFAKMSRCEWSDAGLAFRKALDLKSEQLSAMKDLISLHYHAVGYFKKGHKILSKIKRNDPLHQFFRAWCILNLGYLGDTQGAEEEYQHGIVLFGDQWFMGKWYITSVRIGTGDILSRDDIVFPDLIFDAAKAHIDSPEEGLAELRRIYTNSDNLSAVEFYNISIWAAYFGDPEFAMDAIEKGVRLDAAGIFWAWLPVMKEVRQTPRFKEFVRKIGLVDYWNEFGWPDICRPLDNGDFECD